MISSKVTTTGPYLDPGALPTDIDGGTGWVIGDGVKLTAGHVVFEYNRERCCL